MFEVKEQAELRVEPFPAIDFGIQIPRLRQILPFALVAQDCVLIYAAFTAAYAARYELGVGPAAGGTVGFANYQGLALLLLGVVMSTLAIKGAYRRRLGSEMLDDLVRIFSASTIAIASIVVVSFMLHQLEYSRGVIVYCWIFLIFSLGLGRVLTRVAQGICHRKGWRVRRVLVVGASDAGKMIMQSVMNRPDLGYEIVGFVDRRSHARVPHFGRFQRMGLLVDLPRIIEDERIDDVIVALPGSAHDELGPVISLCERIGVGIKLVPDLFNVSLSRVRADEIAGIPLLDVQEKPIRRLERITKRALDIAVGSLVIILATPIIAVLAVLVRLDSPGPAFIRQERIGKDGRVFSCFKLRSMRSDADKLRATLQAHNEASGPIFKMRNDPRCTRVGRWMRRMSLDELPQVWNVVRGDMSLVGPRPPLAHEVEKYEPWQLRRLEVKPGITGIWQVSGRSNLTFDEMVMMDIMYVDSWSPALDLKILARTAAAVVVGRGAY